MPSLESRMKVLEEIPSENNIILQLEEVSAVTDEEQVNVRKQNQHMPEIREEENLNILPNRGKDDELSDWFKGRKKYKDVADAAQAAFESAACAADAARAAVELSRSQPHDPDDHHSSSPPARKVLDGHDSVNAVSQLEDKEILTENKGQEFNNVEELEKPKDISCSNSANDVSVDAHIGTEVGSGVLNEVSGSKMQGTPFVDLEKRPFSWI